MFCYPEHISTEMKRLFQGLRSRFIRPQIEATTFADRATPFIATLNTIHPFREGNGRTQLIFLALLADEAQHPLDFELLSPDQLLAAMIRSFSSDERALHNTIARLITPVSSRHQNRTD